jgi:hypothetical protein
MSNQPSIIPMIDCRICWQTVPKLITAVAVPCYHDQFCATCLQHWQQTCRETCWCPVCNRPVTEIYALQKLEPLTKTTASAGEPLNASMAQKIVWFYRCLFGKYDNDFDRMMGPLSFLFDALCMLCYIIILPFDLTTMTMSTNWLSYLPMLLHTQSCMVPLVYDLHQAYYVISWAMYFRLVVTFAIMPMILVVLNEAVFSSR